MDLVINIATYLSVVLSVLSVLLVIFSILNTTLLKKTNIDSTTKNSILLNTPKNSVLDILIRIFDIIFSLYGIIMFLPIYIIIALAIKITSKEPVIVKDTILGYQNKSVFIYKFNTNTNNIISTILNNTGLCSSIMLFNILKGNIAFFGLKKIKYSKLEQIYSSIPDFDKPYMYYKPGLVDLSAICWFKQKDSLNEMEYYELTNTLNIEFINNKSISFILSMMIRTIYLFFKPFDYNK